MAIPNRPIQSSNSFGAFCDKGIVFSLCAAIFILPASIAMLDSFAGLTILFYLSKKINRIIIDWPVKTPALNFLGKARFVWGGFAPPDNYLNRPLQFLALAFFISVVFSQYPTLSLVAFLGKFVKCVFLYFSFIEAFRDEKRVRAFLGFFLLSAFIIALSGAVQHYTGRDFLKGHLIGTENAISISRISSTFFGANAFGAYLLPVLGLSISFLYSAVVRRRSWALGLAAVAVLSLFLACLCWTYSRSSWVGYLAILFVTALLDWRKILYVAALLLVFIFIFLPSLSHVRHMDLIKDSDTGVQKEESIQSVLEQGGSGRFFYWEKAVSIIDSSMIWGTGLNTYTRVIKRDPNRKTWWYAHNCYLQLTAETGVMGLVCFLAMVLVLFRHAFKSCGQIKDLWPLTFLQGSIAGLSGFLVQSFFDNTFYTVQLSILMWLIFGLMAALTRLKAQ